jgi:beta-glucosidase
MDPNLSPDKRAELLEHRMTLAERSASYMAQWGGPVSATRPLRALWVRQASFPAFPGLDPIVAGNRCRRRHHQSRRPPQERCNGASLHDDSGLYLGSHGGGKTGEILGNEAFNKGFNVVLAGGANLVRDPATGAISSS